jgi:hypothetical protein
MKECFVVMHHEGGDEIHMVLIDAKHLKLFEGAFDEENREGCSIKDSYFKKLEVVYHGAQRGEKPGFGDDDDDFLAGMTPADPEDKPYVDFFMQSSCIEDWPFDRSEYSIKKVLYMAEWGC